MLYVVPESAEVFCDIYIQRLVEYEFSADFFGTAVFEERKIPCIPAKGQKVFHTGYPLRDIDKHDVKIIDSLLK